MKCKPAGKFVSIRAEIDQGFRAAKWTDVASKCNREARLRDRSIQRRKARRMDGAMRRAIVEGRA